ncbi:Reticulon [Handroanthus impetiginosus]|uniref:Reticulon-like protein n=1 Tax=Handroanthus impetiginosus TaxID=429701 RepID=A0A2G9GA88_9LAMI|nr:Reticulon [Handroanthus impetiginosus]
MPIYSSDSDDSPPSSGGQRRFFGSEKPLHAILGGGIAADILLWRNKKLSAAILIGATVIWFLFEVVEYNFITLLCHVSMAMMLVLFSWSTGAGLMDRNPPDLQAFMIPESTFRWLFAKINETLLKFYYVSSGKDLKTFVLAIGLLWILSAIGDSFSSLNLLYIGFVCLTTLPALYEKYHNEVDYIASRGIRDMKKVYNAIDSKFLNKIPRGPVREKKTF